MNKRLAAALHNQKLVGSDPWLRLRQMRSQPPNRAARGHRRQIFTAALAQAEQLFTAAESVDMSSSPLLVFYGLSQAGRAIAAAGESSDYRLSGHGIGCEGLDSNKLDQVTVRSKGAGSFTQLATILNSPALMVATPLPTLWALLPEMRSWQLAPGAPAPLRMDVNHDEMRFRSDGYAYGAIRDLPDSLAAADNQTAAIRSFLDKYVTLQGYESTLEGGFQLVPWDGLSVNLRWKAASQSQDDLYTRLAEVVSWQYRDDGRLWIWPVFPGNDRPIHPLLAWWSVLYTLSMLARYNPDRWSAHIDVDHSPYSVPVQVLMDTALEVVPHLIVAAISQVSARTASS